MAELRYRWLGKYKQIFANCCDGNQTSHKSTDLCYKCWHLNEYSNNMEYKEKYDEQKLKERELNRLKRLNMTRQQKDIDNAKKREKYKTSPEHRQNVKRLSLKRKYGITIQDYENMLKTQNYKCKICGKQDPRDANGKSLLRIDHNHETLEVRGILCNSCNIYIARIDKDIKVLENLNNYFNKQQWYKKPK